MKKAILSLLLAVIFGSPNLNAQNRPGSLRGSVVDKITGEAIPFAAIKVLKDNTVVAGTTSDVNGLYSVNPLSPGIYTVSCSFVGYATTKISSVQVYANKPKTLNFQLAEQSEMLEEVEIVADEVLIEKGKTSDLVQANFMSVRGARSTTAGVFSLAPEYNTEEYNTIEENGFHLVKTEALSTFAIDADGASYANTRRYLKDGSLPPIDAVRIEEFINYFSYDYPEPIGEEPFSINTELATCPWNKDNYLMHIGIKAVEKETEDLPRSNLVFLLDVSGSMSSYNKLELVKKSLRMMVDQLNEDDRIAIVVYAGASGLVLPSTQVGNKQKIVEVLNNLQAGGSTAGASGIKLAYQVAEENFLKKGNNRILLCTDGDFNVGVSSQSDLIDLIEEKRESGVFLSVFGFGMGNLKDSKMEQLANHGNGTYNYIDNLSEAQKVFVNETGGTLLTIAKDVKIQVEFNPANVSAYRLIGYENRLLNKEDFNDDTKDAGEIGAGHTITAVYEVVPVGAPIPSVGHVDELKYQNTVQPIEKPNLVAELATVKCRYKEPDGQKSKLISRVVKNQVQDFNEADDNMKFSAAVIAWGMLLRNSPYVGTATYNDAIVWGQDGRGADNYGYRSEFVQLVRLSKELDKRELGSK